MYDSRNDTGKHIHRVSELIDKFRSLLYKRSINHDASKLKGSEKPYFDEYTPILKDLKYGTDEYKAALKEMKPALDHHYGENSHHPEHFSNGIDGMTLIDIIEALCDWKASTERGEGGDIKKSLEINKKRFAISDQLYNILLNTVDDLKW